MSSPQRMRGQSTVEFAVGAAALILLLLGVLLLSGFQEAQRRTISAARHAAFLQIWGNARGGEALVRHLHALHFDDPGFVRPVGNPRWIAPADITAGVQIAGVQGAASVAATALLQPLRIASGFLNSGFDLAAGGYRFAQVGVRLRPMSTLPAPFDALDLSLTHSMSLLGDGWNASGSPHTARRTAGLVPTSALAGFSALWRTLAAPLALLEPNLDRLCLGLIEPERVPEDRLGPASGPANQEGACR